MAIVVEKMKLGTAALLLLLSLSALMLSPAYAHAVGGGSSPSTEGPDSIMLTVYCQYEGYVGADCEVSIYRVASFDEDGIITPVAPFDSYSISWDGADSATIRAVANTLEGYILRDGIAPTDFGKADESGVITFPKTVPSLESGYYLVLIESFVEDDAAVESLPVMIPLPYADGSGEPDYQPIITPKFEVMPLEEPVRIEVVKLWEGENPNAPKEVEVQLLRDGEVFDTVTLSAANSWRHTWEDLGAAFEWDVVEKTVLEGYEVLIEKSLHTVSIVNTYVPEEDTPDPKLPQTGALWWPVPVLMLAGLGLFFVGVMRRARG